MLDCKNISSSTYPSSWSVSYLLSDETVCSYLISWCMHEASTFVNGHRIYGDGIIVLLDTFEWSKEKAQLAEETKDAAWHMQVRLRLCIIITMSGVYAKQMLHIKSFPLPINHKVPVHSICQCFMTYFFSFPIGWRGW